MRTITNATVVMAEYNTNEDDLKRSMCNIDNNLVENAESDSVYFSIIIPVFNGEAYIKECLESILSQSYKNFEIILVNDGSIDRSLEMIQEISASDSRIKLIDQENQGVSIARNVGLSKATGKYLLFIDSDDYLMGDDAIKKLHAATRRQDDLVMYNVLYENKASHYFLPERTYGNSDELNKFLYYMIRDEHINSPCNKVYDTRILKKYNMEFKRNIRIGEDLLFNIEYLKHCESVCYLSDTLYFYRTSNLNSATSTYMESKYADLIFVNDKLAEWSASRADDKLASITKYIRIKNIFSCLRDLNTNTQASPKTRLDTARAYKRDNAKIIILNAGIKLSIISLVYTFIPIGLLSCIIWRLYPPAGNNSRGDTL